MADERYAEFIEETPQSWVQGLYEESSTQKHRLGCIRRLADGREFIYVKNGNANMVTGKIYAANDSDVANTASLAITANVAANDRSISFTLGNSNLANEANAYSEGYALINNGSAANGVGQAFKIRYHAAIAANANGTIYLYDKVRTALVAGNSTLTLVKNPCKDLLIHASPPLGAVAGVATYIMTANYYGWVQRKGPCAVLVAGTMTIGGAAYTGGNDGSANVGANGATEGLQYIGAIMSNNADTHFMMVDLRI